MSTTSKPSSARLRDVQAIRLIEQSGNRVFPVTASSHRLAVTDPPWMKIFCPSSWPAKPAPAKADEAGGRPSTSCDGRTKEDVDGGAKPRFSVSCAKTVGPVLRGVARSRCNARVARMVRAEPEPWTIIASPTSHWTHRSCETRWRSRTRTGRRDQLPRRIVAHRLFRGARRDTARTVAGGCATHHRGGRGPDS